MISGEREVGGFFQGVVFQLEDVEIRFVTFGQFFVCEGFEPLALGDFKRNSPVPYARSYPQFNWGRTRVYASVLHGILRQR